METLGTPYAKPQLRSFPGGERLTHRQLEQAMERARRQLLSRQNPDGHWRGEIEGDTILETEYVLLLHYLGRGHSWRARKAVQFVRGKQLSEGGWAIYPGGPPEVSASVKAYLVLKLMGDSPGAPHMVRARESILRMGGVEAVNSFTRILLALVGEVEWEDCPAVPPEMVLLPNWAYFNLYEMSSWSRAIVVPLSILWANRPVRPLPEHARIPELWSGLRAVRRLSSEGMQARMWRGLFGALDRGLKWVERSGGFGLWRSRALDAAERWMLEHLRYSDGLGAIFPAMLYSVFALLTLGYPEQHPLVQQQLLELEKLELEDAHTLRVQPCVSPVWDSALALNALAMSGMDTDDPSLLRAARWILSKEVRLPGDWRAHNPKGPVGGWYFEYANEFYPDCDDTGQVLTAFSRLSFPEAEREGFELARERGLEWVLSMQCSDGGWAAFDRDCMKQSLTYIPFADHNAMLDPSCPDITGRILEALIREGMTIDSPAVRRAMEFLRDSQLPDGTWYGRWGCNYIYGTWLALWGLKAAGEDLRQDRYQRAAAWLRSIQNPDGGFGESYRSYDNPQHKGQGPSTAAQTAWAVMALWATGDRSSESLRRALQHLVDTQGEDGTWHDRAWTGTGFPLVFYLRYELYDDYFPLQALAVVLGEGGLSLRGGSS